MNIKLKGSSLIKVLVFVATCALLYFVVWPLVRDWWKETQYEKMNEASKYVFEAAQKYIDEYDPAEKRKTEPASLYAEKIGNATEITSVKSQIDRTVPSDYDNCYYTVIIEKDKVIAVYCSPSQDSKIVGSYPQESTLKDHEYGSISETKPAGSQ